MKFRFISMVFITFLSMACKEATTEKIDPYIWVPIEVTATAYNSIHDQTTDNPHITAWGDTLVPGMKSIAVSRDLIAKGLSYGTLVRIANFPDTFHINDKMHRRWTNRIDIYMGENTKKAKEWGRKKILIEYAVKKKEFDSLTLSLQN